MPWGKEGRSLTEIKIKPYHRAAEVSFHRSIIGNGWVMLGTELIQMGKRKLQKLLERPGGGWSFTFKY